MSRTAVFDASLGYFLQPIAGLLDDPAVTEIMVNGPDQIFAERAGRLEAVPARFEDEDALLSAIHNLTQYVGRDIGPDQPILDARLPSGARVHAIIPPASRVGPCLTIRKFRQDVLTLDDLVRLGSLSAEAREFLEICIRLRKNILVAGASGAGKTSLLGALTEAIPSDERILVIEDTAELRLRQPHVVALESRSASGGEGPSLRQLFIAALRMRPDRILVGEVRGGEALDMLQAMLSGHSGCLSTVHAATPRDALVRLETLSLMSDVELPVYVARSQVASAVHVIVQIVRFPQDGTRRITRIAEVGPLDQNGQYQVFELFTTRVEGRAADGRLYSHLEPGELRPTFADEVRQYGLEPLIRTTSKLWGSR
ncbi:MAG TPA: ATPase, T2SS/T4P/T4SS family [Pirellulaceae bacterium]|nr:ATPase, T2SS/T4P/T4SS family [Pirellulaceae bacterium]